MANKAPDKIPPKTGRINGLKRCSAGRTFTSTDGLWVAACKAPVLKLNVESRTVTHSVSS